jgi:hypothetical protein
MGGIMADLTGIFEGTSIEKGQSNVITLNKALLNAEFTNTYFDVLTNWKSVIGTYKTPEGQINDVVFDASEASPQGDFNPSALAQNSDWEIQSITIQDFDNGSLKLLRGDLTTADFDIILSVVFLWDVLSAGVSTDASGGLSGGGSLDINISKLSTNTQDFDVTFVFDKADAPTGFRVGVSDSNIVDVQGNFYGFVVTDGAGSTAVWSGVGSSGAGDALQAGSNTIRVSRLAGAFGGSLVYELNGVIANVIGTLDAMYPTVGLKGTGVIASTVLIVV